MSNVSIERKENQQDPQTPSHADQSVDLSSAHSPHDASPLTSPKFGPKTNEFKTMEKVSGKAQEGAGQIPQQKPLETTTTQKDEKGKNEEHRECQECSVNVLPLPDMLICGEDEISCGSGELAKVFGGGPQDAFKEYKLSSIPEEIQAQKTEDKKPDMGDTEGRDVGERKQSKDDGPTEKHMNSAASTMDVLPMPDMLMSDEDELCTGCGELGKVFVGGEATPSATGQSNEHATSDVTQRPEQKGDADAPASSRAVVKEKQGGKAFETKRKSTQRSILGPLGQPFESFNTRLTMPFVEIPDRLKVPTVQEWNRTALSYALRPLYIILEFIINNPATAAALTAMAYAIYISAPLKFDRTQKLSPMVLAVGVYVGMIGSLIAYNRCEQSRHVKHLFWHSTYDQDMNDVDSPDATESVAGVSVPTGGESHRFDIDDAVSSKERNPRGSPQDPTSSGVHTKETEQGLLNKLESMAEGAYENLFGAAGDPGYEMVGDVYQEQDNGSERKLRADSSNNETEYSSLKGNTVFKRDKLQGTEGLSFEEKMEDSLSSTLRPQMAEQEGGYVSDSDAPGPLLQGVHSAQHREAASKSS